MKKEQIKNLAKEFLKNNNLEDYQTSVDLLDTYTPGEIKLSTVLTQFLQSMIDQGHVVEAKHYDNLKMDWLRLSGESVESTVSSAGKEVNQELVDEAKEILKLKYLNSIVPDHMPKQKRMIDFCRTCAELIVNGQFKSSPASSVMPDYDIEQAKKDFMIEKHGHEYFGSVMREFHHWQNEDKINEYWQEFAVWYRDQLKSRTDGN